MMREFSTSWIVWSLLSAVFAAATAILAKIGIEHIDPNLATALRTTVVVLFTWLIVFVFDAHHGISSIGQRSLLFLTASGIATGLSWLCYFRALSLGPASKVAPVDKLSVVFVLLLAWLLLGEQMTWGRFAGGSLVTAGAIVLALTR